MNTLPLVVRQYEGTVIAIFPTRRSSHYQQVVCWAYGKGEFEIPLDHLNNYRLRTVNMEHREQLIRLLNNVGFKDLRYYSSIRDWMHRDRFQAGNRNEDGTYPKRTENESSTS